jgi:hypothetical protein
MKANPPSGTVEYANKSKEDPSKPTQMNVPQEKAPNKSKEDPLIEAIEINENDLLECMSQG